NDTIVPPVVPEGSSDYSRRVVAYINGNEAVTREQLGEFLIARFGPQMLDLLVNRRIIERAAMEKGIEVTEAEIDEAMKNDLKALSVNQGEFVNKILKRYNKTLYEWRQDKIRPSLYLAKMCRERIKVEEEDVKKAFEA